MPTFDRADPLPTTTQPTREQMPTTEPWVEVIQCSDELPVLTDDEVYDVLKGLEETFSVAEVDELVRGLGEAFAPEEAKEGTSNDHYVDDEIDTVMNMDISDFIV